MCDRFWRICLSSHGQSLVENIQSDRLLFFKINHRLDLVSCISKHQITSDEGPGIVHLQARSCRITCDLSYTCSRWTSVWMSRCRVSTCPVILRLSGEECCDKTIRCSGARGSTLPTDNLLLCHAVLTTVSLQWSWFGSETYKWIVMIERAPQDIDSWLSFGEESNALFQTERGVLSLSWTGWRLISVALGDGNLSLSLISSSLRPILLKEFRRWR